MQFSQGSFVERRKLAWADVWVSSEEIKAINFCSTFSSELNSVFYFFFVYTNCYLYILRFAEEMASNSDEKFFEDLFLRNNLPSDNAISNSNITYEFCWLVFDKYDKIYRAKLDLPEHVVMENVFKWHRSLYIVSK